MAQPDWTFLTNHAHVAICLAGKPDSTIRDLSQRIGITERAVQNILNDMVEAGYLERIRVGRHNEYQLRLQLPLRHSIESHRSVGDLVRAIVESPVSEG